MDENNKVAVTLEQWQILSAIETHGGIQAAADALGKSQSTVSYSVQRLQERLGVTLFKRGGRKAELTELGLTILRRARKLLNDAQHLELASKDLALGWEPELRIVVDAIFPMSVLNQALAQFAPESRGTRLDIFTTTLSGTDDMIIGQQTDIALTGRLPISFLGEDLFDMQFVAVAHPQHALFGNLNAAGEVDDETLEQHRQIVVRDSGIRRRASAGWLSAEQRWTVSSFAESVELLLMGVGFAFVPLHLIDDHLASGRLRPLPLNISSTRKLNCKLLLPMKHDTGPAAQLLAEHIRKAARVYSYPDLPEL